ncbi:MAG: hypothetical protein ACI902_000472 [Psychroserpens sp.]
MRSTQQTYKETLQLICDILSFQNSVEDLKQKIASTTIQWDPFVTIASDHLVLTTCYCRLSRKKLLSYLPKELETYMEELTRINRNRNHSLLHQVDNISNIFNKNAINYTLLKGTALMAGNYFEDLGERMVGDIDILVEKTQINKAQELLIHEGYESVKQTLRAKYFDDKHLPRLIPNHFIGAVELHSKVLTKPYNSKLRAEDLLRLKTGIGNTSIPSDHNLLEHSILNFQINDSGHFYNAMSIRSLYDALTILKTLTKTDASFFELNYVKSFTSIGKLFFNDFDRLSLSTFQSRLFLKRIQSPFLKKTTDVLLKKTMFIMLISNRIFLFTKNKHYRLDIIKDYRRIFSIIKS